MIKQIEETYFKKEEKSLYINISEKINLVGIVKYAKKANRKKLTLKIYILAVSSQAKEFYQYKVGLKWSD